jgi:hypothetical protein
MSDTPYSISRGRATVNNVVLTHAEWHPCSMGIDIGSNETVLHWANGETYLIQHGWPDFKKAESIIVSGIFKNWGGKKISDVMDRLRRKICDE